VLPEERSERARLEGRAASKDARTLEQSACAEYIEPGDHDCAEAVEKVSEILGKSTGR
jgi:hypothetical protein